jgi:hypothetical protein
MNKSDRYLNGYRLIYAPNHYSAMRGGNWDGYIYEHRYVWETHHGSSLGDLTIHHADGDRLNNSPENLVAMTRSEHAREERFLQGHKRRKEQILCVDCGEESTSTRCRKCYSARQERIEWPDTSAIREMVENLGYVGTGRVLGVSDNAVRKRLKNH